MADKPSDTKSALQEICPEGDVVLVVGKDKVRMRVMSQCMGCASKVFHAMFTGSWSEGLDSSSKIPKEIALPEDDAKALHVVCAVVHHRPGIGPNTLSAQEIFNIAVVSDKYDLGDALKFARAEWLQMGSTQVKDLGWRWGAARLFGDAEIFRKLSVELMLHSTASYRPLLQKKRISPKMIYLLEERRKRMRTEMAVLMIQEQENRCRGCRFYENRKHRWQALLLRHSPLMKLTTPLSQVIKGIEAVSCDGFTDNFRHGTYPTIVHHPTEYVEKVAEKVEAIKKRVSICIDCVQKKTADEPCRFKHE